METWVFCSFRVKYVLITGAYSYYFWKVWGLKTVGKIPGIRCGTGQLSVSAHHHGICKQEVLLQFWSISDLISDLTRAIQSQITSGMGRRAPKSSSAHPCLTHLMQKKGTKGGEAPVLLPFTLNHLLHHSPNSYQVENHLKKYSWRRWNKNWLLLCSSFWSDVSHHHWENH